MGRNLQAWALCITLALATSCQQQGLQTKLKPERGQLYYLCVFDGSSYCRVSCRHKDVIFLDYKGLEKYIRMNVDLTRKAICDERRR